MEAADRVTDAYDRLAARKGGRTRPLRSFMPPPVVT